MATIMNINLATIKDREKVWNVIMNCKKAMARVNFNFAMACAYALGENVPTYTMEDGTVVEPTTFAYAYANATELANDVGMNKGTISKTLKAFKWIVDGGKFEDFASGKYWFNYDKIAWLTDREKVFTDGGYKFDELMMDSLASLKIKYANLLKKGDNARLTSQTESDKNSGSNTTSDDDEEEILPLKDSDIYKLPFEGETYEFTVGELRAFLKEHGKVC